MIRQALLCVIVVVAGRVLPAEADEAGSWRAGVASAVVTPDEPMWMAGYASRDKPSEGKVHELFIKALALEDADGGRFVVVTSDLISVPRPIRDAVASAAQAQFGLDPGRLLMNCSHTHCGPEIRMTRWSLDGLPPERREQSEAYAQQLQDKFIQLVKEALDDLSPARVAYCHARCGFAMNRRTPSPTGYRNFPNPEGPVDHDVPVLRIDTPEGALRAVLFGYACHNTTLGFYKFCGDYAGYAQQMLEAAHPEATALFMLGCGGDQNPYPRGKLELAMQHGQSLANAVEAALLTERRPLTGALQSALEMAVVEYQTPPSREELERRVTSGDQYDRLHAERLLVQLAEEGKLRESYECPVQVVRLGDQVTLVALPGETVVDYSLRLKADLLSLDDAGPAVWVAGYSNDVFAYVPSRRVLLEGGYEGGGAMRYFTTVLQPGPFAPSVEESIVSKVHELHERLMTPTETPGATPQ